MRVRTQVGGGLVRTRGQPFQMVLGGPDYNELAQWRDIMLEKLQDYPGLTGADSDYKETRPQMRIRIDRTRAVWDELDPLLIHGAFRSASMSAARVWSASAPWPGAGRKASSDSFSRMASVTPRRVMPDTARRMASNSPSAARSYNVTLSEGRRVACALIPV